MFQRGVVFSERHPLFFIGSALWIGCCLPSNLACAPLLLLFIPLFGFPRAVLAYCLIACAFCSFSLRVSTPPRGCYNGTVEAEVLDRHLEQRGQKPIWKITLFIRGFWDQDGRRIAHGTRTIITAPSPCPIRGGCLYRVSARAQVDESGHMRLFPHWAEPIEQLSSTVSSVEWRVSMRRKMERRLALLFKESDIRFLAGAMTCGLYRASYMQSSLNRVGLGHLLAISGFHFGCIVALVLFFSRRLSTQTQCLFSLVCMLFYFFLVGPSASVVRALCAATLLLLSKVMYRKSSGINSLGLGLIVILTLDPAAALQTGFHLSFLATLTLLLYSPSLQKGLQNLFTQRSIEEVSSFSWTDQIFTGILHRCMPVLSILLPVWGVVALYQLVFFQECSLLGLLYNLALPLILSLAIPFVFFSLFPIPIVSNLFATIASIPLKVGLCIINGAPSVGTIEVASFPILLAYLFFIVIIVGGIFLYQEQSDGWKACL